VVKLSLNPETRGRGARFLLPSNPLMDSLAAVGIKPIVGREERSVITWADAYSRARNGHQIGVCLVQAGPGAEHAFGGIAQAYADSVPLLFLPGGASRDRLGLRTNFDAVEAYRPISKCRHASRRGLGPRAVAPRIRQAPLGTTRPSYSRCTDVQTEEFPDDLFHYESPESTRSAADPAAVRRAIELLLQAKRRSSTSDKACSGPRHRRARRVRGARRCSVATTYTAKSAFPERHPLSIGAGAPGSARASRRSCGADLIFSVGASLTSRSAASRSRDGKTMIQCTNDPDDLAMEYPLAWRARRRREARPRPAP